MNLNPFLSNPVAFNWLQLGIGFLLASVIVLIAYFARSLNVNGAIAAVLLGTAIFGLGGLPWAVLLIGFYLSSSLLSHLFKKRKDSLNEKFSKGSQRDAAQVLANGGIAGLLAVLHVAFPQAAWPWVAATASLAAANADTWATELGVLSPTPPRVVTNWKKAEAGTSGAVSVTGTLAAAGGALLIAILALLVWPPSAGGEASLVIVLLRLALITLAGLIGSLLDSLLGASLQAIYHCPTCNKETERHPLHICGTATTQVRGFAWLNNDWVNVACTFSGALIGLVLAVAFPTALALQPGAFQHPAAPQGVDMMKITSPVFAYGEPIPAKYTCKGADVSPPLNWEAQAGAQSYALIVDDPDAPAGIFTHWVIYNLPADLTSLPEGVPANAYSQGKNNFGRKGYNGPCPPAGKPHRYNFTLMALDLPPTLPTGLDKAALLKAVSGHILAQSVWMGTFQR